MRQEQILHGPDDPMEEGSERRDELVLARGPVDPVDPVWLFLDHWLVKWHSLIQEDLREPRSPYYRFPPLIF